MKKKKNSKIMLRKVVDVNDTSTLTALSCQFGYCIGDVVCPNPSERSTYWSLYGKSQENDSIKCSWVCNRERPISGGCGRKMEKNEVCVVLDMLDAKNGRLTHVLTQEGKKGWVLSSEVQLVTQENEKHGE